MKQVLVFVFLVFALIAKAENLPEFPKIDLEKVTIGKNLSPLKVMADQCTSQAGGCGASCGNDGCRCSCGVALCVCTNPPPLDPEEGGEGDGGAMNIYYNIDETAISNLTKSAEYFKNQKTEEGDKVYLALVDVAEAIIKNDEKEFLRAAYYINSEVQKLDFMRAIDFNKYALKYGITTRL